MAPQSTPGDLATPAGTARIIRTYGLRPRKRWGQHFLVSRQALDRILQVADLARTDTVLEIGAGLGTLTVALAERAGRVIAVEIDPALLPALRDAVGGAPHVTIVHGDVLALDLARLFGESTSRTVVANLPYNIASLLIVSLLERPLGIRRMVLTVQREVADRLAATPGSKDYGLLSVAVQYRADAALVGRIPPGAFYPPPDVESGVVRLEARGRPGCAVDDEGLFFRVVRAAFAQRRKMLRNALASGLALAPTEVEAACAASGIEARRRGETLTLEEFAALANSARRMMLQRSPAAAGEERGR